MSQFSKDLIAWYQLNKRSFPWREQINVYHTWICEVMSQQTTLAVVLPRFKEFINELPDLHSLANCSDEKLRKLWVGLGYYARARNLRNGAQYILQNFDNKFPSCKDEWLKVPGCGPYTASIISSICFNEPVACVDGNVVRVVSRILGMNKDVWEKIGQEKISCYVNECIPKNYPGCFNQAMMDLGATVCKKQNPICQECPIQKYCYSFKNNIVSLCPPNKPRKDFQTENIFALLLRRNKKLEYSIILRNQGFLAKTKGFPLLCSKEGYSKEKILAVANKLNLKTTCLEKTFKHSITHHKITGHTFVIDCNEDDYKVKSLLKHFALPEKNEWFALAHIKQNISSSLDLKVLKTLSSE
ncbi:A/G-specific adenine glycosylase [Fluviispira multicolorata]|uniref:A/G-specific adenine glycosylase n=1 Tax=Fluviispira multicolorata TaxID=2654512 RepID=A0A833JE87_9BACT|nr:A/G-specific adenine glycosylase [Fluviispira multicolorata]KAB8032234.1 A/G-specific adenine glycosylase [Fluviispira multicolorata]